MCSDRRTPGVHELFREALPLADRAANARSARVIAPLLEMAMDPSDVRQEVLTRLLVTLAHFDPLRACMRTFAERVTTSCIASILRRGMAAKRTMPVVGETDTHSLTLFEGIELRVDLHRVLANLDRIDREISGLLGEHGAVETAKILRISRGRLYRGISRIRGALREAGYHQ